jgi:16S rRNA pseudouridine516 synthase
LARLDATLARNLGWSRRQAREAIAAGRVRIGDAGEDRFPVEIELDGERRVLVDEAHLILNKPTGCVTALRDARHPTAYALLRGAPLFSELRPVGRLDLDTVPRTYEAVLARPFRAPPPDFALADGHRPRIAALEPLERGAHHPSLAVPPEARDLARITIVGGAYHEVRRIFAALGSYVLALCRTAFGRLALPLDLAPGDYRLLGGEDRP